MFIIIGSILNISKNIINYNNYIKNGVCKNKLILSIILSIIWSLLILYITYSLCHICRDVVAVLITFILGVIHMYVNIKLFPKIFDYDTKLYKDSKCDCNQ